MYRRRREMHRSLPVAAVLSAVALAAAIPLAGCGIPMGPLKAEAHDTWTHTYSLSKTGEVSITNVNGRVEVEGVDGSTVEVSAERIARGATDALAKELLPRIPINDRSTPDLVLVETGRISGILIGASFEVRYHVKAPRNATVRATTVNGGVELKSLAGRASARTTNGGVNGEALSGGVEARTVNGGITMALTGVGNNDITLATVNGGIILDLPATAKATVNATWVNGGFHEGGLKFDVRDSGKRHFEGLLNGGGTPINLTTVNGGVHLDVAGHPTSE